MSLIKVLLFNVIFRLSKLDARKLMELSKIVKNACTVQNKTKIKSEPATK